jgi:hypothetical protein
MASTKIQSTPNHYIGNASIIEKSNQIPGNQLGFWKQDQPPAIELPSSLKIDTNKGLP